MNIDPGSIMAEFHDRSWNVQNTIRSLPSVICGMLKHCHPDGTPFWARVEFANEPPQTHNSVVEWVTSGKRSSLGMSLKYLFHLLGAHDDLMGKGSADKARSMLAEHGIRQETVELANIKTIRPNGRPSSTEQNFSPGKVTVKGGGNVGSYLAARLKKERPDLLAELEEGKLKSLKAAATKAGILKPTATVTVTVEGFTKAIKKRLTPEQIKELVQNLSGA
jgi:hypothetical protein